MRALCDPRPTFERDIVKLVDESWPPIKRQAWRELDDVEYGAVWDRFESKFSFNPSSRAEGPAIVEPAPSITFDLGGFEEGAEWATSVGAIQAEAMRCFISSLPDAGSMYVLDWQHPAYEFRPELEAVDPIPRPLVDSYPSVYPNGDYYAYLTLDLSEGTFGHPWESSLCVLGQRLVETLGQSLATWLPVKRINGQDV